MAKLKIITEPDPILRKVSKPVTDFDARLHQLLDDMTETCRSVAGLGLAAVQVGILYRACIVQTATGTITRNGPDSQGDFVELINPEIVLAANPSLGEEGCLSVKLGHGNVRRPQIVRVRAQDRHGNTFKRDFHGMEAVCVCHEIDHLDGILFTDKVEG